MIKIYAMILILAVLGGVGYGAFWYYNDTQARIQQLAENNAKLEAVVSTQNETIGALETNSKVQAELNKDLQKQLQAAEKYQDELQAKLQKHDLTRLSEKKPGLIEKRINNGTKKLFDSLESDTAK
jgi:N-methylhydantoinase B/oxoprolinase/acetone carboxylase alpha subunit